MIGVCYALKNEHKLALRYILLAYIEDTLNTPLDSEAEADSLPAAQMLRNYYGLQPRVIQAVKKSANQTKREGEWPTILDPTLVLRRLGSEMSIETENLQSNLTRPPPEAPRRIPLGFPQPWEKRVFIGGNYQTHMPVLRHVERIVASLGFTPVIAFDVEISRESTYHHTLMLLHTCEYAVFEISAPSGQLMEIERTRDYQTKVLLLYSTTEPSGPPSQLVSSMLTSAEVGRVEGYVEMADIEPIIARFLGVRA